MKRSLKLLCVMLVICIASSLIVLASFADDSSAQWSYESYGDGVVLTEYLGNKADVYVPSTIEADGKILSVLKLGDGLFENNDGINSVTLGAGIAEIGDRVFYDCDKLVCVLVSEELTTIGDEAFADCDIFNSVILYDEIESIGTDAFVNCPKLTVWCNEGTVAYMYVTTYGIHYSILSSTSKPETVELDGLTYYIQNGGAYLLASDSSITEFTVPATVNGFPVVAVNEAFRNNDTVEKVTLPEGLKVISSYAFYDCDALVSVNIPESLTALGEYAFYSCEKLASEIVIPAGVKTIGAYTFYYCSSLKSVTIGENVESIGNNAFYNCVYLTEINFDAVAMKDLSSYNYVFYYAGYNSSGITVNIGASVTKIPAYLFCPYSSSYNYCRVTKLVFEEGSVCNRIESQAFYSCSSLKEVHVSDLEMWCNIEFVNYASNPLYYSGKLYLDGELLTELVIPETITAVKNYAFYECSSITELVLHENIESIGTQAFSYCDGLTEVVIPGNAKNISDSAFYYCAGLESVTIGDGITSIANNMFYRCTSLKEVVMADSVTSIGTSAFYDCTVLESITLGAGVKTISSQAFYNCTSLKNVNLGENVETIGNNAFANCYKLRMLVIPEKVRTMNANSIPQNTILAVYAGSYGETYAVNNNRLYAIYDGVNLPKIIDSDDGLVYFVMNGEAHVISYEGSATEIEIPATVESYPVVTLNDIFRNNDTITKVTLPEGLKTIKAYAFNDCDALVSVNLPSTLTALGEYAFYSCEKLASDIVIPDGVKTIGAYSFYYCSLVPSITIGEGVESIGYQAFYYCRGLTEINYNATAVNNLSSSNYAFYYAGRNGGGIDVTIGANVTCLPAYLFYPYSSSSYYPNIKSVVFEEGSVCKSIGNYAFARCATLKNITIPDSVEEIGMYAFYSCTALESVTIGNGVKNISDYAFRYCIKLAEVTIPESVKTISQYAFYDCGALTRISLSEGLESVGQYAFASSYKVDMVIIPESVTALGTAAFHYTTVLAVYEGSSGAQYAQNSAALWGLVDGDKLPEYIEEDGLVYFVVNGKAYLTDYRGEATEVVVPETICGYPVVAIYETFRENKTITKVTLPEGLEIISNYAFYECNALTDVNIPSTLTSLGDYAFYNCAKLVSEIVIPDGVKTIGTYSFYSCSLIPSLTIGEGVEFIGNYAFYYCRAITEINFNAVAMNDFSNSNYVFYYTGRNASGITVTIGANVTRIPSYLFLPYYYSTSYYPNISKVIFEEGSVCKSIGGYSFAYCSNLLEVTIPDSVETINNYAFYYCGRLAEIVIPDSVKTLNSYAFGSCANLAKITLGTGIETIGSYAFSNNMKLSEVVIPETVKSIGYGAFQSCAAITKLTIKYGVETIGDYAFYGCSGLVSIVIPDSVTAIGTSAFRTCTSLKSVELSRNLKTIGAEAFHSCTSLASITLPEGLETIRAQAFVACTALRFLYVPESVTTLYLDSVSTSTVLLVQKDSYAHTFAESNNMLYHVLTRSENPNIAYGESIIGTVKDSFGNPIAGATVELYYTNGELKDRVTTDSNGNYKFSYAEVDSYIIVATDGYGNAGQGSAKVSRIDVFSVTVSGDRDIVLKTSYTISGTLSAFPAKVTVIDERGNIVKTFESRDGSFAIAGIVRGEYTISATTQNGYGASYVTVYNSDVSDIYIEIAENTMNLNGAVVIAGRDGTLSSAPYVQVSLYDANGNNIATVKTNSEGKYQFANLPVGSYSIVATATELRPDKNYGYDRLHTLTGYASVSASEGGEIIVSDIVMRERTDDATASIGGKVTAEGTTQDCTVILTNSNGDEIATYNTGKNGKFKFVNLPDGKYTITAITGSNGVGTVEVVISGGESTSDIHIKVAKSSKVVAMEAQFNIDVPVLSSKEEAELYRDRISAEKKAYDALSKKEKKELSAEYVERLEKYVAWLAECEVKAPDGVVIEQGGLIVSGDEIANGDKVSFELNLEATESWVQNPNGVETEQDHLCNMVQDAAGDRNIVQYYEITMSKTLNGVTSSVTDVYKDTDAAGKFRITLPIPAEYLGFATYAMVHVHNGEITTLMDYDDDPNTITIEVDKFSTFVLIAGNTELTEEVPCEHDYDNDCDAVCNWCEEAREVGDHVYDNACDADCNVCGDEREVDDHVYDNACDADCNVCGDEREADDHVYDNACDADCNVCGDEREVDDHVYDNACDADCNVCGDEREVDDHVYDNACDADCNVCGDEREVNDHVYDNACDADCNVCEDEREVGDHVFGDWEVVKEPTTTEEGERKAACTECGETKSEKIEKLPEAPEEPETPDEPGDSTIPEAPEEPEEELGFFAKIWKAIVDFFRALFGLKTED